MAEGTGRSDAYVQLLIKAGVPLALAALAALFYVRKSSSLQSLDNDDHSVESADTEIDIVEMVSGGLVDRINELQLKGEEVEARFERYQSMKEHEAMIVELKNMFQLEMVRGEYLVKEVSSMESEVGRMQDLFHQVENLKLENERLKKKVKRYDRKCKEMIRVNGARKVRIRELEDVIRRSCDEVEKGSHIVNKMGEEIYELQGLVDALRSEKTELSNKLKAVEEALTLKNESEMIRMEECTQNRIELEKLKEEFSTEEIKLVQLRWANAFLRRRLMKKDGLDHVGGEDALLEVELLHYELDKSASEGECSASSTEIMSHKKSLTKKPVKESDHRKSKMSAINANKGDLKSYGRHYSWDWVEEHVHGHGRKSFSSG